MDNEELIKILEEQISNDFCTDDECNHKYIFCDDGVFVCKKIKCFTEQIKFVSPYTPEYKKDSNTVDYFKKHLAQINIPIFYEKEAVKHFLSFEKAFNDIKTQWNRKSFICYDLVMYCVLRYTGICPKALKEFNINHNHIPLCKQVLEQLGWVNIFPMYYKEMESIIEQFVTQLKTIDESINEDEIKQLVFRVVANKVRHTNSLI